VSLVERIESRLADVCRIAVSGNATSQRRSPPQVWSNPSVISYERVMQRTLVIPVISSHPSFYAANVAAGTVGHR
jgi:hypothetical protein